MIGTASAPASSANLGPGFDVLALALEIRCVATAEPADEWLVTSEGEPADEAGAAIAQAAAAAAGPDGPLQIAIESDIPVARGLGSSAALIVAVSAASLRAGGTEPISEDLYALAAEVEGHGDNVAAAVYGGLVAVAEGAVRKLEMSPRLGVLVAVPEESLTTAKAREALPTGVALAAAARSVARGMMLVEGLRTGDRDAFFAASGDELHEPHRAGLSAMPALLMEAARSAGALHASWSGAGPSVIAFVTTTNYEAVNAALTKAIGDRGRVLSPSVAVEGWR